MLLHGVTDRAFPPTIPCLLLFLAAVSQEWTSWVPESYPCFSTLGFASGHLSMLLLPPPCPLRTRHRMVVPLAEHHFQPQIQGPSLCTEVAGHPGPLPLQDRFAFQHPDLLHKQEGKNLAWGTKCHKHVHVTQVVQARETYACLSQITLCEVKLLRNIDFWNRCISSLASPVFLKTCRSPSRALFLCHKMWVSSHTFPIGLFQAIPSLLLAGTKTFRERSLAGVEKMRAWTVDLLYPIIQSIHILSPFTHIVIYSIALTVLDPHSQ